MISKRIIGTILFLYCSDCKITKQIIAASYHYTAIEKFEVIHKNCGNSVKSDLRKHIERISK